MRGVEFEPRTADPKDRVTFWLQQRSRVSFTISPIFWAYKTWRGGENETAGKGVLCTPDPQNTWQPSFNCKWQVSHDFLKYKQVAEMLEIKFINCITIEYWCKNFYLANRSSFICSVYIYFSLYLKVLKIRLECRLALVNTERLKRGRWACPLVLATQGSLSHPKHCNALFQ